MSRLFDDGSNEYLEIDQSVIIGYPFTMACWYNSNDDSVNQQLMWIGDKDVDFRGHGITLRGAQFGDYIIAHTDAGAGSNAATTDPVGYATNTWEHVVGVWAADNDRRIFLNGTSGTDGNVARTPASIDRFSIGRLGRAAARYYMSGSIAESAIWNVALTDEEITMLSLGYSPLFVRPESLLLYIPLVRDNDDDLIGGLQLVAANTPTISAHPRIRYPSNPYVSHIISGAPPVGVVPQIQFLRNMGVVA